jgi:hypothetical protein
MWSPGPLHLQQTAAYGIALVWIGILKLLGGPALLTLGWISRRRNHRPFWQ